jgi:hypothetical protein
MSEQEIHALLERLVAQADTRFEQAQGDYRALIVVNPTDAPYTGVAVLHVDMPLKAGSEPRPAAVWTPDGVRVPCQILHSRLEPVSEWRMPDGTMRPLPDGSRRWRFDLAFWVEDLPPRSYRIYRSEWSVDGARTSCRCPRCLPPSRPCACARRCPIQARWGRRVSYSSLNACLTRIVYNRG